MYTSVTSSLIPGNSHAIKGLPDIGRWGLRHVKKLSHGVGDVGKVVAQVFKQGFHVALVFCKAHSVQLAIGFGVIGGVALVALLAIKFFSNRAKVPADQTPVEPVPLPSKSSEPESVPKPLVPPESLKPQTPADPASKEPPVVEKNTDPQDPPNTEETNKKSVRDARQKKARNGKKSVEKPPVARETRNKKAATTQEKEPSVTLENTTPTQEAASKEPAVVEKNTRSRSSSRRQPPATKKPVTTRQKNANKAREPVETPPVPRKTQGKKVAPKAPTQKTAPAAPKAKPAVAPKQPPLKKKDDPEVTVTLQVQKQPADQRLEPALNNTPAPTPSIFGRIWDQLFGRTS